MKLYKYCDNNTALEILRHSGLCFHTVFQLDDPFSLYKGLVQQKTSISITEEQYQNELLKQYQRLPANIKEMINFAYFLKQAEVKRESIIKELSQHTEKQFQKENTLPPYYEGLGIAIFYARGDNPLLWQYQADNHHGIVIEFDAQHTFFSAQDIQGHPQLLQAVRYQEYRVAREKLLFPELSIKGTVWQHEQEWRLFRSLALADYQHVEDHIFKLPSNAVSRVILGSNMSIEKRQEYQRLLDNDKRYRHVMLQQCILNQSDFSIQIN